MQNYQFKINVAPKYHIIRIGYLEISIFQMKSTELFLANRLNLIQFQTS